MTYIEQGTRVAIIDMGSNSIRLLLGTFIDGKWCNEPKVLWTTRLGKRTEAGLLSDESIRVSLAALVDIQSVIEQYGATVVYGFATSAVREAPNGQDFMAKAANICPMKWSILSGDEEAIWGFRGALLDRLSSGKHYATIDIGGGSTELALGSNQGVYWSKSYPVGAVRFQPVSEEGPQRVWEETRFMWDPMPIQGDFDEFIAIGGTATTLAAIDLGIQDYDGTKVQHHKMTRERVEGLVIELRYMSREERLAVPGLPPGRADIIVAGAEILTSFMDAYEVPHIFVSDKDGMEALQQNLINGEA